MKIKDLDTREFRIAQAAGPSNAAEALMVAQEMAWGFPTGEYDEPAEERPEV